MASPKSRSVATARIFEHAGGDARVVVDLLGDVDGERGILLAHHFEPCDDGVRWIDFEVVGDGGFFALADNVGAEAFGVEYFRLASGPSDGPHETDLFAGIDA